MTITVKENSLKKQRMKRLELGRRLLCRDYVKDGSIILGGSIALGLVGSFLESKGYEARSCLVDLSSFLGVPIGLVLTMVGIADRMTGYFEAEYLNIKKMVEDSFNVEWYEVIFKGGDYVSKEEVEEILERKNVFSSDEGLGRVTYNSPWYQRALSMIGKGRAIVILYPKGDTKRKDLEEMLIKT
jgi:hypothetical protein